MSGGQQNPVFCFDRSEPEMQEAYRQARSTFRVLWRELSWERRRIIPALDLACVKTIFADRPLDECGPDDPVEQMWLDEIEFDGQVVSGKLLNAPNYLKSVRQGDVCAFEFGRLTDWMYAISGTVYGAHTVNLMRSRMAPEELQAHDEAWGLVFDDPLNVRLTPEDSPIEREHPMSVSMKPSFIQHLKKNPEIISAADDRGWTILHSESLAGNALMVEVLLAHGADRSLQTDNGARPIDLARCMNWDKIVSLLGS